ncbi:hypothetical protein OAI33_14980 [Pirellulaceae bacterium]|nr:hypothetical protein [Pirellulaceae bacterium]
MFYKEYLLLILICSVILTGCNSYTEEKAEVRRNKVQIDAQFSDLENRILDLHRQEESMDASEVESQLHSLAKELYEVDLYWRLTFEKVVRLFGGGSEAQAELYPSINNENAHIKFGLRQKINLYRIHDILALRCSSVESFCDFFSMRRGIDWNRWYARRNPFVPIGRGSQRSVLRKRFNIPDDEMERLEERIDDEWEKTEFTGLKYSDELEKWEKETGLY